MTSRLGVAASASAVVLLIAGCGSSTPHSAPTSKSTATPAAGPQLSADGFTYRAPKGWKEGKPPVAGIVSLAGDPADKDGFVDNVNVILVDPTPTKDIDELEKGALAELKGLKSKSPKIRSRFDIDGSPAIHITSGQSRNGIDYLTDQYAVIHDGKAYTITFSFSADVPIPTQESLSQSVMSTWKWSD